METFLNYYLMEYTGNGLSNTGLCYALQRVVLTESIQTITILYNSNKLLHINWSREYVCQLIVIYATEAFVMVYPFCSNIPPFTMIFGNSYSLCNPRSAWNWCGLYVTNCYQITSYIHLFEFLIFLYILCINLNFNIDECYMSLI